MFFEDDSYQVPENNGSVSVCVRREGDAAERFSIEVATAEQTPVQAQGTPLSLRTPTSYSVSFSGHNVTFSWKRL